MDKPRLDQGPDYERGFIDGMMYQTETTVNRAVDAMSKRTWAGLTDEDKDFIVKRASVYDWHDYEVIEATEAKLKEKNT